MEYEYVPTPKTKKSTVFTVFQLLNFELLFSSGGALCLYHAGNHGEFGVKATRRISPRERFPFPASPPGTPESTMQWAIECGFFEMMFPRPDSRLSPSDIEVLQKIYSDVKKQYAKRGISPNRESMARSIRNSAKFDMNNFLTLDGRHVVCKLAALFNHNDESNCEWIAVDSSQVGIPTSCPSQVFVYATKCIEPDEQVTVHYCRGDTDSCHSFVGKSSQPTVEYLKVLKQVAEEEGWSSIVMFCRTRLQMLARNQGRGAAPA